MHENRETSGASRSNQDRDRSEKAISRTADRHVPEESDRAVVPMNLPNNEERSSAEVEEGRARAKENIAQSNRAGKGCPKDCAVCDKQPKKGGRNGSPLCSTT